MTDMYAVPDETLTGIANAIRSKTGSDEQMPVSAMAAAIEGISGGGFIRGTIEYTERTNYIRIPSHGLKESDKFAIYGKKLGVIEADYTKDGLIAFSVIHDFFDGAWHISSASEYQNINNVIMSLVETRNTFGTYANVYGNMAVSSGSFGIENNEIKIPCRNGNYQWQLGTWEYVIVNTN